jgi:hypothetical protein
MSLCGPDLQKTAAGKERPTALPTQDFPAERYFTERVAHAKMGGKKTGLTASGDPAKQERAFSDAQMVVVHVEYRRIP